MDSAWAFFTSAIAALFLTLLGYIANGVRKMLARRGQVDVEGSNWRDQQIKERIVALRHNLPGAIRAYFSRFHNGDHYVEGSDILKKTRTYESTRPGIEYQQEQYKGMTVSSVQEEMELVEEDGHSFRLVRDIPWCKFKRLCEMGGALAVARCAVRKAGKIVGFVGVDFDTEEMPENLKVICECAGQIGELL